MGATCFQSSHPLLINANVKLEMGWTDSTDLMTIIQNAISNVVSKGTETFLNGVIQFPGFWFIPSGVRILNYFLSWLDIAPFIGGSPSSEDCLFLDAYVPGKAFREENLKLPVINWIYGGAYIAGVKDGWYDGTPVVKASGNNLIYVAANYRVSPLTLTHFKQLTRSAWTIRFHWRKDS